MDQIEQKWLDYCYHPHSSGEGFPYFHYQVLGNFCVQQLIFRSPPVPEILFWLLLVQFVFPRHTKATDPCCSCCICLHTRHALQNILLKEQRNSDQLWEFLSVHYNYLHCEREREGHRLTFAIYVAILSS